MAHCSRIDKSTAWQALLDCKPEDITSVLNHKRLIDRTIAAGGGLSYCYAAMDADDATLGLLGTAAAELDLAGRYLALAGGSMANPGEQRMALHHLSRGQLAGSVHAGSKDLGAFYTSELTRFSEFAKAIRSGSIRGSTGKAFTRIVQIGIGGSDLGPRALYLALEQWARERGLLKLSASFISNVDPDDANGVLAGIDPEATLFILVSKSGTTQETLANEALVRARLASQAGIDARRHLVAVTSETSPLAKNTAYLDSFYIDDYIGGRYSSTSAVGGLALSLALGPEAFTELLAGAHEADRLALEPDMRKNAAMTDAMLGLYERSVLGRPATAILPYSQALSRFPAHLQQLDMESNGKRVDMHGEPLRYPSGPIVFGEPGTNGQHSFYQLLHQGTDIIPLQFIGFRKNQTRFDPEFQGSSARTKLNANLAAQIVAFARGQSNQNPNKLFPGQRPSSLLVADELNPRSLGALLAHYENKVMFQGFAWNINSFDQEGVQLGKLLAARVLQQGGPQDEALEAYGKFLGIL